MLKPATGAQPLGDVLAVLALGVVCYAAAYLGLRLSTTASIVTPVWPVAGIAFAALYRYGYRLWPGLFMGVLAALAHALGHAQLPLASTYLLIVGPSAVVTLEVLGAVWLVRRALAGEALLASPSNLFGFAAVSVLASALAAAATLLLVRVSGWEPGYGALTLWLTQWLGDLAGLLLLTPALLAGGAQFSVAWTRARTIEAGAALVLTFVAAQVLFGVWFAGLLSSPMPLPIVLCLLWVAIRFGLRELSLAMLVFAVVALHATLVGAGPYPAEQLADSVLRTLAFVIVVAAGLFVLGAALLQSRRDSAALRDMNNNLEQRVRQRTADLANANKELQRFRDRLQELVVERTADLELAKTEIESFSYSVSHDLRSPLRAIDGYSHALLEDYGDRLDERGRDYLLRSRAASQRMGDLIDDVLLLSRVTRHELELHKVDLSTLARSVVDDMRAADPRRDIDFVIEDGLSVLGDEHLLRIVLENLLGNAWKYTSKRSHAQVQLGRQSDGEEQVFYVRDNGIGFDMHYSNKLFGAFQRLHSADEYEGTGIGLATVQRVMTRHGGRVWAEGNVNKGAVFYLAFSPRGRTTGPRKTESGEVQSVP